ncbi:ATP-binding cassette domain-containing protein [Staphylococcus sp. 18_1_E_LY]|uniref:ATP-binding cassette domain-containing protein n=1 Tax=Staphylococcus lloydii TaxID=2781774 RepID=A0A7T1FA24_9STAP|nr:ABC transporter ATP-binding protein [Staphylococcus lloydii]MBF7019916.1 ATP-binding cassette domain-containing protein [Staphylococcus lloydii]MBF7027599.1 ATP-binding cassette domain-containing protein [Staphylococcus lloydii]QPM75286.1 ATP-binding cassette domain-containing protein [Staphylococcus lloydii]
MIKFDDVTFNYASSRETAIKNVSLQIKQGELVVLCGKSGSGKSTITKLINGLIPKVQNGEISGHVYIDGQNISEIEMYQLSQMVGSVFQNPKTQFYNVDTTSELAFNMENQGIDKEVIIEKIKTVMNRFKIEHLLNRNIFELSGGEKQIIACASVLISNPEVIVLDEPSSNLDMFSIKKLKEMICYLKKHGKTIVLIEHRMDYIINYADSIYYMDNGEIHTRYYADEFKALNCHKLESMGVRHDKQTQFICEPKSESDVMVMHDFTYAYDKFSKDKQLEMNSVTIPRREVVAIIGDNGSGKSTFAKCLCGLPKHFNGHVTYDNRRLKKKQLLKYSYMVFQDVNTQLFTENLNQELQLLDVQVTESQVDDLLGNVNLLNKKYEHPLSLSGGEKQRIAIATAILSDKEIIIFDEPTSGLDLYHMKKIAEMIKDLHDQGKQIFIITHDKSLILEICTYVLHFADGRIVNQFALNHQGMEQLNDYFDV